MRNKTIVKCKCSKECKSIVLTFGKIYAHGHHLNRREQGTLRKYVCSACGVKFKKKVPPSNYWQTYCSSECGKTKTGRRKGSHHTLEARKRISAGLIGRSKPKWFGKKLSKVSRKMYANGLRTISPFSNTRKWLYPIKSTTGKISIRSSWESFFVELLETSDIVKCFTYEPFQIQYRQKDGFHTYFPDFFVTLKDGRQFLFELRAKFRTSEKICRLQFKAAKKFCKRRNMKFIVLTDKPTSISLKSTRGTYAK